MSLRERPIAGLSAIARTIVFCAIAALPPINIRIDLLRFLHQPNLRNATPDPVGIDRFVFCWIGQCLPELDDITVSILQVGEAIEALGNFLNSNRCITLTIESPGVCGEKVRRPVRVLTGARRPACGGMFQPIGQRLG